MRQHLLRRALRPTVGVAVVVAGGLLLGGCATDDTDAAATAAPTSSATESGTTPPEQTQDPDMSEPPGTTEPDPATATPEPTATQEPTEGAAVLTEQDSGAALTLAVGEERPLRLGNAWSWSEPVVEGAAVALTPVDFLVDPGYVEWLVTGASAGSATLEVVGEPVCGDTTVCPPTTVTLDVEVTG